MKAHGCQVQESVFNPVGKWEPIKIFKPEARGSELCFGKSKLTTLCP